MSEELFERIKSLLESESLGVLGTSDHGHPYTSLVVFAETEHLDHIIFLTRSDRRKFKNLKSDSRISMYIDSRERWTKDPATVEGLSIMGVAWEIKREDDRAEAREHYLKKNPHMKFFTEDPNVVIFRINVETYKYVVNFEEAYEFKM